MPRGLCVPSHAGGSRPARPCQPCPTRGLCSWPWLARLPRLLRALPRCRELPRCPSGPGVAQVLAQIPSSRTSLFGERGVRGAGSSSRRLDAGAGEAVSAFPSGSAARWWLSGDGDRGMGCHQKPSWERRGILTGRGASALRVGLPGAFTPPHPLLRPHGCCGL